jgi:hypothetical protein
MGEKKEYKFLVGKPEEMRSLGKARRGGEDNIEINIKKTEC